MRVAICDSNVLDREMIADTLHQYFAENCVSYKLSAYSNGISLLHAVADGELFDLIFLDIYYIESSAANNINGMDIARQLRQNGFRGAIVFLTDSSEFVFEGYDVNAAAYLLKPHNVQQIHQTIDRILKSSDQEVLQIHKRSAIQRIPHNEILFVESSNSKCILHRSDGSDYTIYKHLGDIEADLHDHRFLRCHQSYLVNMDYIQTVDKAFTLTTGDTILIRQRELKHIRDQYLNYTENK